MSGFILVQIFQSFSDISADSDARVDAQFLMKCFKTIDLVHIQWAPKV